MIPFKKRWMKIPLLVRELLVGDGKETGITTKKIANEVKGYLADDGIIDSARDSINATLKKLTKR